MDWLKRLFHLHQWEIIKVHPVDVKDEYGSLVRRYDRYTLRCTVCGTVKKKDMK